MSIPLEQPETDAEVLAYLRGFKYWPADLDPIAVQAVEKGCLRSAYLWALHAQESAMTSSPLSSATIRATNVPPHYSALPNWEATFFAIFRQELHRLLGLPKFGQE